jgi:hypothetical protein
MTHPDPLSQFTEGDKALTSILRSVLEHVAAADNGGDFAIMASDVLTGRLDPREVTRMSVLESDIQQHVSGFLEWKAEVGEAEVARQAELAQRYERAIRTELDDTGPHHYPGSPVSGRSEP